MIRQEVNKTIRLTGLITLFLLTMMEIIARTNFVQHHLLPPQLGSSYPVLENMMVLIQNYYEQENYIDCVFVGNSIVFRGIDPSSVSQVYLDQTGRLIRCFNFGITGATASDVDSVVKIVLQKYKPAILIYGFNARDFNQIYDLKLRTIPWVRFYAGEFSIVGWLTRCAVPK